MPQHPLSSQNGASLVEMLVATALGLVILVGASPLLLQMLQQQAAAQQRLEQAEALRFASQVISQHIRDAKAISPASDSTLLEVLMPSSTGANWQSFACMQTADDDRLQLIYNPSNATLSCRNATTHSPQQVLIDKLWPIQFEYGCLQAAGTSTATRVTHTTNRATDCPNGVASVTVSVLAPSTQSGSPSPAIRWTTVNRAAMWPIGQHNTP
jgi:type II secretory pathway pseudopilin PulG